MLSEFANDSRYTSWQSSEFPDRRSKRHHPRSHHGYFGYDRCS
ncbi:hypothetical protein [Methylophaga sp.]